MARPSRGCYAGGPASWSRWCSSRAWPIGPTSAIDGRRDPGNDLITAIDRRVAVQMRSLFRALPQQFLELRPTRPGPGAASRTAPRGAAIRPACAGHHLGGHRLQLRPTSRKLPVRDPQRQWGFDSKLIVGQGDKRNVSWTRRDAQGRVTGVSTTRRCSIHARGLWYQGAERSRRCTGARPISSSP